MTEIELDIQALNECKKLIEERNMLLAELLPAQLVADFKHRVIIIPDDRSVVVDYEIVPYAPANYISIQVCV